MPNMIDNIVGISGPYDRLAELCHAAQKNKFLQAVKPLSPFAEKQAIEHWGVKWELSDPYASLTCDVSSHEPRWCLDMQFESPWAPPLGAYQYLEEEGCFIDAFFLDISGLDYGGTYHDGNCRTYPTDLLPDHIKRLFETSYDYQRLARKVSSKIKAA